MELKKQLEKIIADLAALEARKEKFFAGYDSQKKKLLQRKKETEEKISQEHKKKILQAIEENFGEITDETMPAFIKVISSTAESWNEISGQEAEENAGDGIQTDGEGTSGDGVQDDDMEGDGNLYGEPDAYGAGDSQADGNDPTGESDNIWRDGYLS